MDEPAEREIESEQKEKDEHDVGPTAGWHVHCLDEHPDHHASPKQAERNQEGVGRTQDESSFRLTGPQDALAGEKVRLEEIGGRIRGHGGDW